MDDSVEPKRLRYEPKVTAKIEALYEPGESTLYLSDWSYQVAHPQWQDASLFSGGYWKDVFTTISITLALTQERLHMIWWKSGFMGGNNVASFRSIALANAAAYRWGFDKTKSNKGVLTGYTFSFGHFTEGKPWSESVWSAPAPAEPFMELFQAAMARYMALAGPVDMAAQLRALQTLVNDGILTRGEMQRAKDLFLGRPPDQRQLMERNLRSLHELRKSGVLNQIEFDIKKQDILATTK
jgi:hypothetical protein